MKTFEIGYQYCDCTSGTKKYKAKTKEVAEALFASDYGSDYLIIFTREV
jgi:hypothetical protein